MSRHLIKNYLATTSDEEKPVVIDTNDIIAKKLEALQKKSAGGGEFTAFGAGDFPDAEGEFGYSDSENADEFGALFSDEARGEEPGEDSGNVIKARPAEPVYEGPSPEELIAKAQEEIEAMRQEALLEIETEKEKALQSAYEQGHSEGYNAGKQEALAEIDEMKSQLIEQQMLMEEDYQNKLSQLEPQFIDCLTPIYEHVIGASLSEDMDAIRMLVSNAVKGIERCRSFLIHVCSEDYETVAETKAELARVVGLENVLVEVVSDMSLAKNECTIETENGVYDCSLGTQLSLLRKQLRILAYNQSDS